MGVKELVAVEGWPDTHASMLYKDDIADHTDAPRPRGCARPARCSSGSRRRPSSARSNWTRTYLHGMTRNPWNPERTPGGSSGGSAAAVAVGHDADLHRERRRRLDPHPVGVQRAVRLQGRASAGSATHGNFDCGLTSVPGPMCRSVRDAARYVDAIAGPTDIDPTSLPKPRVVRGRAASRATRSTQSARHCARRGRRRSASRCATPRSRSVAHEAALALVRRRRHRARRRRRPPAAPGPGVEHPRRTSTSPRTTSSASRGSDEDVTPVSRAGFEAIERHRPSDADAARAAAPLASCSRAIADVFDEVDLFSRPPPRPPRSRPKARRRWRSPGRRVGGMGSVPYTAPFNISGMPAVSIPVGTQRRRAARRAAGRRPPPRGRARPRVRRDRRDRTAPGRSSPPWRTPDDALDDARARIPCAVVTDTQPQAATRPPRQEQEPASEEVTEVAPGVLRMQLPIWMPGLGHVNMYGLVDDRGLTVVDPGPARSAVVEGAEAAAEDRGLPA